MEKMEKDKKTDELEHTLKKAFGFDEEQLLQELHMAEMAIHDDELPEKSAEDFEKAVIRMQMNVLRDKVMEAEDAKGRGTRKKKRILKAAKVIVVAAALIVTMFGMTIVGIGGKHYYFTIEERDSIRNDVVFNNDEMLKVMNDEEEAYREAENRLQTDVLKLGNRPDNMEFEKIKIESSHIFLVFTSPESSVYLYQNHVETGHSYNVVFDGKEIGKCKNEWLNEEFSIFSKENENGWEYAVRFVRKNSYFVIEGYNLTLDEFLMIISDLHF